MNASMKKILSQEQILRALTEFGEDPSGDRIALIQAAVDASAFPEGGNDDAVKAAVDAARRILDARTTTASEHQDAHELTPAWTSQHHAAALREGWGILDCAGSQNGRWQVQTIDESEASNEGKITVLLDNDDDAFAIVANGVEEHHIAAREFLFSHNRDEFACVMKCAEPGRMAARRFQLFYFGGTIVGEASHDRNTDRVILPAEVAEWLAQDDHPPVTEAYIDINGQPKVLARNEGGWFATAQTYDPDFEPAPVGLADSGQAERMQSRSQTSMSTLGHAISDLDWRRTDSHGRADPEEMNDKRASWANAALVTFMRGTRVDRESAVGDLLCALMHYSDRSGGDFMAQLISGFQHYGEETSPDTKYNPGPPVSLSDLVDDAKELKEMKEEINGDYAAEDLAAWDARLEAAGRTVGLLQQMPVLPYLLQLVSSENEVINGMQDAKEHQRHVGCGYSDESPAM